MGGEVFDPSVMNGAMNSTMAITSMALPLMATGMVIDVMKKTVNPQPAQIVKQPTIKATKGRKKAKTVFRGKAKTKKAPKRKAAIKDCGCGK